MKNSIVKNFVLNLSNQFFFRFPRKSRSKTVSFLELSCFSFWEDKSFSRIFVGVLEPPFDGFWRRISSPAERLIESRSTVAERTNPDDDWFSVWEFDIVGANLLFSILAGEKTETGTWREWNVDEFGRFSSFRLENRLKMFRRKVHFQTGFCSDKKIRSEWRNVLIFWRAREWRVEWRSQQSESSRVEHLQQGWILRWVSTNNIWVQEFTRLFKIERGLIQCNESGKWSSIYSFPANFTSMEKLKLIFKYFQSEWTKFGFANFRIYCVENLELWLYWKISYLDRSVYCRGVSVSFFFQVNEMSIVSIPMSRTRIQIAEFREFISLIRFCED